jgi:uncharacterized secreted protein with C-terminal beta-propeller domain
MTRHPPTPSTPRRTRHARRAPALETLEPRQLLSAAVATIPHFPRTWTINGDRDPAHLNDTILVAYNDQTRNFDLTINGTLVESRPAARLRRIVINGGKGDDTITVESHGQTLPVTLNGGDGNDTLTGGDGNDLLSGGDGDDTLDGAAGNDAVAGGKGNDSVCGGAGKDRLNGNAGNNVLYGIAGKDKLTKTSHDTCVSSDTKPAPPEVVQLPGNLIPIHLPLPATNPLPHAPISDALRQRLIDEAVDRYRSLLGTPYPSYYFPQDPYYPIYVLSGGSILMAQSNAAAVTDHSSTNVQVQGVDEADLVETDGSFIYTLQNGRLNIIDVRDPENARVVSTTIVGGYGNVGLYLDGDKIVVVTSNISWNASFFTLRAAFMPINFGYSNQQTSTVTVLDVSDPAQPSLVERTSVTGTVATSRMVGDQLYLVLNNSIYPPAPHSVQVPSQEAPIANSYRYQTADEYRQWLSDHIEDYLPTYSTTLADGTQGPIGSLLGNIAYDAGQRLEEITSVLDINVADAQPGVDALVSATGNASVEYASGSNLYLFTQQTYTLTQQRTTILKFNLGAGSVQFDASGQIDGHPLNSYAIDEYHGQLRVVTENATYATGYSTTHSLLVLTDTGTSLAVTGQLSDIGNDESLRSVLFMQDRAFVVTFKSVDPLFAIDLSNPDHPASLGELVMPGFSTYLYPLDHDHLIGIGRGEGAQAGNFHTVQVSLYNVADLTHPSLVDQKLYDTSDTTGWGGSVTSIAGDDPHAFSYFADAGILAIPLASWGSSSQNDLALLRVNPTHGFTALGDVTHASPVQRSLRIGDNLYSIASGELKIVKLLAPSIIVADIMLPGDYYAQWPGPIRIMPMPLLDIGTVVAF